MKKTMLVFLLFTLQANAQSTLKVMTFNIRLNVVSDSSNAWPFRKDKVASQILFHGINLLGVQEALHEQMLDLAESLPRFKYVGVGRDDGKTKGEYSAIFYDTTKLQLLDGSTFWLSQTPTVAGSKGWDAVKSRIVTWCRFKVTSTGKTWFAFNTHFDHKGSVARKESAKFLLQQVKDIAGGFPAIITGDFNAIPDDEPIKLLMDPADALHLTDTKAICSTPHYGPTGTFTGFASKEVSDDPIDYIFITKGFKVLKHATIAGSWKGKFASDHFSVVAELTMEK